MYFFINRTEKKKYKVIMVTKSRMFKALGKLSLFYKSYNNKSKCTKVVEEYCSSDFVTEMPNYIIY